MCIYIRGPGVWPPGDNPRQLAFLNFSLSYSPKSGECRHDVLHFSLQMLENGNVLFYRFLVHKFLTTKPFFFLFFSYKTKNSCPNALSNIPLIFSIRFGMKFFKENNYFFHSNNFFS